MILTEELWEYYSETCFHLLEYDRGDLATFLKY